MSQHIEWVHAGSTKPGIVDAAELDDLAPDGNDANDIGMFLGDGDGAILYGSQTEVAMWLHAAIDALEALKNAPSCESCGQPVEPDDGGAIWYHSENMSMFCDGDDNPDLLRQASPTRTVKPTT